MKKISLVDYSEFEYKYWQSDQIERFGQAFMNQFGYKNEELSFNLFYEKDNTKSREFILTNLIDFPK